MGTCNISSCCYNEEAKMTSDMKSSVITTQIVIMTTSKETLCTEPNISDSTITLIQSI